VIQTSRKQHFTEILNEFGSVLEAGIDLTQNVRLNLNY
jgi:hypothetical protein